MCTVNTSYVTFLLITPLHSRNFSCHLIFVFLISITRLICVSEMKSRISFSFRENMVRYSGAMPMQIYLNQILLTKSKHLFNP